MQGAREIALSSWIHRSFYKNKDIIMNGSINKNVTVDVFCFVFSDMIMDVYCTDQFEHVTKTNTIFDMNSIWCVCVRNFKNPFVLNPPFGPCFISS